MYICKSASVWHIAANLFSFLGFCFAPPQFNSVFSVTINCVIFFLDFCVNFTVFFVVVDMLKHHIESVRHKNDHTFFFTFRCLSKANIPNEIQLQMSLYSAFNDTLTLFCCFLLSASDIFESWCKNSKIQFDRSETWLARLSLIFVDVFQRDDSYGNQCQSMAKNSNYETTTLSHLALFSAFFTRSALHFAWDKNKF